MRCSKAAIMKIWILIFMALFTCRASSVSATTSQQSQPTQITQNLALGATASSILLEPGYDYSPWRIFDNDPTTTWTEGVEGQGYGESLEIYTNQYAVITGGVIYPGYYKNEDLFLKNSAPRQLYIRTGEQEAYLDVTEYASNWYDNFGGYHFVFDEPMVSDGTVLVTILAVRNGWKYADTCISELRFEGYQGTAADVPELSQDHPRAIIARPADDMGVTLDQVTWTSDDPWAYPDMYSNPDGVGGDGLGPDELYQVDGDGLQFLDGGRSMMLAGFASALYKMHCGYANPEPKTILSKDLFSFSHAFMLYWYQYNVSDARIIPNGDYNLASEADLKAILQEMFTGVDEAEAAADLDFFCGKYGQRLANGMVKMQAIGDFGDAGTFYLGEPNAVEPAGERTVLIGDVLAYSTITQAYEPVMPYYAYFIQDEGEPYIFRFDELLTGTGE